MAGLVPAIHTSTYAATDGRDNPRDKPGGMAPAMTEGQGETAMAVNLKRLVYFDSFMDPIANAIISKRDDIDLVRLDYAASEASNWSEFAAAHGYQIQPRGELREPWFADAALLARCPNMLAVSSTGAGYDMIDVDACTAAGVIVVNQSGTNWEPVAEHALGLMLSLTKKIAQSERAMKRTPDGRSRWRRSRSSRS